MFRFSMHHVRMVCALLALGLGGHCLAEENVDSFDWRDVNGKNYMTLAKPQGNLECRQFAGIAVIEAKIKILTEQPDWEIDLSEWHIVNLARYTSGMALCKNTGILSEADMPYGVLPIGWPSGWQDRTYRITDYVHIMINDENSPQVREDIQSMLRTYGPLYTENYHGNTLVGYDDTRQVWIFKETGGTSYGDNGYVDYAYGYMSGRFIEAITGDVYYGDLKLVAGVPEPATMSMIAAGMLVMVRRRRK